MSDKNKDFPKHGCTQGEIDEEWGEDNRVMVRWQGDAWALQVPYDSAMAHLWIPITHCPFCGEKLVEPTDA